MRDRLIELLNNEINKPTQFTLQSIADNLLENGVIVPPCKVGDKVYIVAEITNKIIECTVLGFWICETNCSIITDHGTICSLSLAETVFLTREAAEQALKGGVQE